MGSIIEQINTLLRSCTAEREKKTSCAEQLRADGVPRKYTATAGNQAGEELVAMLRRAAHHTSATARFWGAKELLLPRRSNSSAEQRKQKGMKHTQMIHNRNAQRARVSSRAERGATTPATAGNQAVEEWVPITHGPRPCDPALRHHRQKRV